MTETTPPESTPTPTPTPTPAPTATPSRWHARVQHVRQAQVRVTSVVAAVVILLVGGLIGFGIAQAVDDSGHGYRFEDGRGRGPGMDMHQLPDQRQAPQRR